MQSENDISQSSDVPSSSVNSSSPTFLRPQAPFNLGHGFTPDKGSRLDPSPRPGKRPRLNPVPLTAAAAMADAQREMQEHARSTLTSPNPAHDAQSALMGVSKQAVSAGAEKERDVQAGLDATTSVSEPLAIVAENIQQTPSDTMQLDSPAQTSPASLSSLGTIESATAPITMPSNHIASPAPLETAHEEGDGKSTADSTSPEDGNKSFSYPGIHLQAHLTEGRRGMSLPHSGLRHESPRSPSNKKHRCPYCATEFTRHHNLKSHLLTHSQEKPYVCSTCQSRFRRLHDLKRHTKLHTGERPHICEKCGRKFARGDALARHNKGPGGCAGRRASMDGFGGDDDFDDGGNDDSMDGLVYGEPETLEDEDGSERRPGMPRVPSIKRHAPSADSPPSSGTGQSTYSGRQPSTYPPIQGRPPGGIASGVFPPRATAAGPGTSTAAMLQGPGMPYPASSSASSNLQPPSQGSAVFPQSAMTESPKPLSPGSAPTRQASHHDGGLYRNRASSVTAQFQQQHFGRGSTRQTPPAGSMSVPVAGPQLPPPPGLNPPDSRFTLPSQGGPTHPPTQPSGPPTHMSGTGPLSSHSNSLSSHAHSGHSGHSGHSAQGSAENAAAIFGQNNSERLWAYVKSLEQRMNGMQEKITSLEAQLAAASQPQARQT